MTESVAKKCPRCNQDPGPEGLYRTARSGTNINDVFVCCKHCTTIPVEIRETFKQVAARARALGFDIALVDSDQVRSIAVALDAWEGYACPKNPRPKEFTDVLANNSMRLEGKVIKGNITMGAGRPVAIDTGRGFTVDTKAEAKRALGESILGERGT